MEGSNINTSKVPDRVVRMELIAFFTMHPETIDTPQSLAARLGRNEGQIEHEMDELVQLGILRKRLEGSDDFYTYIPAVSAKLSKKKPVMNGKGEAAAVKRDGPPQTSAANRYFEEQVRVEEEDTFEAEVQDANGSA